MDNLKEHIKQQKELIEENEQLADKLAIVKEEVFDMKADILGSAFAMLATKFNENIDDWLKVNSEKIEHDKDFGDKLKQSIENVVTAIAQQKAPTIEFKPQVKVDMQPIANEISRQNEMMLKLLNKLSNVDNTKTDELQRLILIMTQKQIHFLETEMKQFDYTDQLNLMAQKPEYTGKITKRDDSGRIDTWTMKPINSK